MSEGSPHKKTNPRNHFLILGIGLVVIVALMYFVSGDTSSGARLITPLEYQTEFLQADTPHMLLDVRTADEFANGHIPGAVNISVDTLERRLNDISRDLPIVIYCRSGNRSAQAATILTQAGYTMLYDLGGIITWSNQGFPVQ